MGKILDCTCGMPRVDPLLLGSAFKTTTTTTTTTTEGKKKEEKRTCFELKRIGSIHIIAHLNAGVILVVTV